MSKNILIFADGTGQIGGIRPDQCLSNIYKLYRATRVDPNNRIDPAEQVAFYHPGLGTHTDAGGLRLRFVDKVMSIFGLLTGMGISDNVIDCYEAILSNFEAGDRIHLFGFSRGAYTVRSVAGVLKLCGIPTQAPNGHALPTSGPLLRSIAEEAVNGVYEYRAGQDGFKYTSQREEKGAEFRAKYKSNAVSADANDELSNVAPYFIGVFDTVAALGATGVRLLGLVVALTLVVGVASAAIARIAEVLVGAPFVPTLILVFVVAGALLGLRLFQSRWRSRDYDLSLDSRIVCARHALAIDETRKDFERVPWGHSKDVIAHAHDGNVWFKQVWFCGDHSDIGGSYSEDESRLSDIALEWMVEEMLAVKNPVKIEKQNLNYFPSPNGMQHSEVQLSREVFPWLRWEARPRKIDTVAPLHPTVLLRFELPLVRNCRDWEPYRPESLRKHQEVSRYYADH